MKVLKIQNTDLCRSRIEHWILKNNVINMAAD